MKRGQPMRRTQMRRRPSSNEIPADVRAGVVARAHGRCERCGEGEQHGHLHHRKSRRFRDHRPCNLLYLCARCHSDVHSRPSATVDDRPAGWVLFSHVEPADAPVRYTNGPGTFGRWVILGNDYEINEELAA